MNPPPPIFPAEGCTTARAKPVAMAASTAFPPARSTSAPTRLAMALTDATMPLAAPEDPAHRPVGAGSAEPASDRPHSRKPEEGDQSQEYRESLGESETMPGSSPHGLNPIRWAFPNRRERRG